MRATASDGNIPVVGRMAVTAASARRMGSWGAAAAVAFGLIATAGEAPARAAAPAITEYSAGLSAGAGPNVIAPGPSGTMWFSEYDGDRIAQITPSGAITEYPTAGPGLTAGAEPSGVVTDGGDVWFTEFGTGELGEIDPATGRLVGEYPVPAGAASQPEGIVVGPDGALWFTERAAGQIGRLDPALATPGTENGFSEFQIPTDGSHIVPQPVDLVDGASGTIWVTLVNAGVASVVPAGSGVDTTATITRYTLPTAASTSEPEGIAIGPDGDPWVAEYGAGKLARIDPAAVQPGTSDGITEAATGGHPLWLATGGDGDLWATDNLDAELLRFDSSTGTTATFAAAQGVNGDATSDAVDADGNVWFTEFHSDRVGEVSLASSGTTSPPPPAPPTETLTITMTGSGTGTVAGSAACAKLAAADATCQVTFPYGTAVTLTGTPTNGSTFIGWLSVGDSLCVIGSCTIAMDGNETVTAFFESPQTLTAQLAGSGQGYVTSSADLALTPGAVNCVKPPAGPQTCTTNLTYGTELTLRAVATDGSTFAGWSGACSGVGTCGVLMDSAQAVTATFTYDPGVHVNAIEVTQGIQTDELPTRTTAAGYAVSYHGVTLSSEVPSPEIGGGTGVEPVTALLAEGHATVVRVYINTQLPRHGQPAPAMTLRAYRDGKLLAPGPIGADEPPNSSGIPVGALGSVLDSSGQPQRDTSTDAYTFTLPLDWVQGNVSFDATIDPEPYQFPYYCPNTECLDGGIELDGIDFHPVTHANIDPIAILVGGVGPRGYLSFRPQVDPAWSIVQDVVPFPVNVGGYQGVINATSQVTGCDGVVQGSQTTNQFAQAVYQARNGALLALVVKWADRHDTSVDDYPYALVRAGTASTCTGVGSYSGGVSTGNRSLYTSQPESVSSDDRPLTGIAHEFHHGIGLPHAGELCGSGQVGTAQTLTGSTTAGSTTLTLTSAGSGLGVGQPISGPGIPAGAQILSVAATTVTMTQKATSTNAGQSYSFTTGGNQIGSVWPPEFTASSGVPADGLLDGVGLVGLENPANSPYTVRGPAVAGSAGHEIYDLMSYCTGGYDPASWISVRNWNYDVGFDNPTVLSFDRRHADRSGTPARAAARSATAVAAAAAAAATTTPTFSTTPPANPGQARTLAVMSIYDAATGRTIMTDVEPDTGAPTPAAAGAEYTLTARNAAGQVIARAGTVNSLLHVDPAGADSGASMVLIQGKIAAANARQVDVLQLGSQIGSDRAAASPPTITLLGLRAGSTIGGTRGAELRWRTHAASGRALQVTIDFSADGGRSWQTVYEGDDTGSALLPGELFAASRNARIRAFASDGFSEAVATSPPLVSPGVPPQVAITSPASAVHVPANGVVNLAGTASDGPRRELTGHALVWRAGRQLLGYGSVLVTAALTAGRHTITLTAHGAGGRTALASVRVTVTPAQPALTLVHAPARISARARTVTLELAADEAAQASIGKHRVTIGRAIKAVHLTIKPGKARLSYQIVVRSGPYSVKASVAIAR